MENIKVEVLKYVNEKGEVIRCCVCKKQIVYPEKWYRVDRYYCKECYEELVKSIQFLEKKFLDG